MRRLTIQRFLQEPLNLEAQKVDMLGKVYKQLPFEVMTSKEDHEKMYV